ncbi:MAG TPA: IS200/IS605 family transposase [Gemmatales bacterium]|nr:IS200/IS605 family transposase [Gemmatales bacterium]
MPSTYTKLYYHIIYSTKERRPLIDSVWEERLYSVIGGIIREHQGVLLAAGGMPDHVHLLVSCRPTVALSSLLRDIKSNSSNWVHEQFTKDFAWQEGYSAFTVSHSGTPEVKDYIAHQKEHHRKRDYKEELLAMLKLNEVEFDERYVFN